MRRYRNSEDGQAIILLVLALTGLLGFTALALDGALVYSDRRTAQNAADAGSVAGAGAGGVSIYEDWVSIDDWTCTDNGSDAYDYIVEARAKAVNAATERVKSNDYEDGLNDTQVTVTTICSNGAGDADKFADVEVEITTPTRPSLIHFVYKGPLVNTVTSVGRIRPGIEDGFLEGNAIVGLKPHGCDVVRAGGNPNTIINGGSIFVNSDDPNCAFRQHGTAEITVNSGDINVVGGASYDPSKVYATVNENRTDLQIIYPDDVPSVPIPPECDPSMPAIRTGQRLEPGYWSGFFPPNGVTELGDPASDDVKVYCVDYNHDSAFRLNATDDITGHNVFIYMLDGGVRWNGGAVVNLDAPDPGDRYQGLLIYVDPHNYQSVPNETVVINGQSGSSVEGTLFAPAADCTLNGTGAVGSFHLQAICYTVELLGNGLLDVAYDPGENMVLVYPADLELKE